MQKIGFVVAMVVAMAFSLGACSINKYGDVKEAIDKMIASSEKFAKAMEAAPDGAAAAKALTDFVADYSSQKKTFDALDKKYPELKNTQKDPPPELKESLKKLQDLGTKMGPAMMKLSSFASDPAVQAAMAKMQEIQ